MMNTIGGATYAMMNQALISRPNLIWVRAKPYPAGTPSRRATPVAAMATIAEFSRLWPNGPVNSPLKLAVVGVDSHFGGIANASSGFLNAVDSSQTSGNRTNREPRTSNKTVTVAAARRRTVIVWLRRGAFDGGAGVGVLTVAVTTVPSVRRCDEIAARSGRSARATP